MIMHEETPQTPVPNAAFKMWLTGQGPDAGFHRDVDYVPDDSGGHSIRATKNLASDAVIVTLPFECAITPSIARAALASISTAPQVLDTLVERQLICGYICAHGASTVLSVEEPASTLQAGDPKLNTSMFDHAAYLETLPPPSSLVTPLHWSESEFATTQGTNLYRATLDRRATLEAEFSSLSTVLSFAGLPKGIMDALTWPAYLTASTYLSSRAFPSTLLSSTPSLVSTAMSHPVLLPGIDAANHARGAKVSWSICRSTKDQDLSTSEGSEDEMFSISLVTHDPIAKGEEVFNNYGAKPNAELVLGYGFAIPDNPDDTIVLLIGGLDQGPSAQNQGPASTPASGRKFEVGRKASGVEGVYAEIRRMIHRQFDLEEGMAVVDSLTDEDEGESDLDAWEDDLDAAETLGAMTEDLLEKLPSMNTLRGEGIREEVSNMMECYVRGQMDILMGIETFAEEKRVQAYARAERAGVKIVDDDKKE